MVHSIELVFDHDTEVAIRRIWGDLTAVGISSQAPASRPHVTLVVADRIAPDVDAILTPVVQRLPLRCSVGASVLFGRSNAVLARLVVPTAELLAVHAEVHRLSVPYMVSGPMPNCLPGHWTGHVTLARRVGNAKLGRALHVAARPPEIAGSIVGLRRWDGNKKIEHLIN